MEEGVGSYPGRIYRDMPADQRLDGQLLSPQVLCILFPCDAT